ncbi:MAG: hypothetical protein ACJ8F7_11030 [Gemmataceae bacterium]
MLRRRGLLLAVLPFVLAADPPKPPELGTITDAAGKEVVLKKWSLSAGTRKLGWLPGAPEALAFRETNSTTFVEGVVTLIPLDRLASLIYDAKERTVKAKVAGLETPLEGSIRYKQTNQVAIEAEVDKREAGVLALKYRGGQLQGGIQAARFPGAKPGPAPIGDKMFVTIAEKGAKPEPVHQLRALYRQPDGKELLSPTLTFKVSYKLDLAQVAHMKLLEDSKTKTIECDVTLKDGTEQSLTLLPTMKIGEKEAKLEGLLAVVPAGYKLFPPHCIEEISREGAKTEPQPVKNGGRIP